MKKNLIFGVLLGGMLAFSSCGNNACKCNCNCGNQGDCQSNEPRCEMSCAERPDGSKAEPRHGKCHKDAFGHDKKMSEECKAMKEKWAKFDSLSVEEQKELIAARKKHIDERDARIEKARKEFEEKWANFDSLSVEEQKMLLDAKSNFHQKGFFHHKRK